MSKHYHFMLRANDIENLNVVKIKLNEEEMFQSYLDFQDAYQKAQARKGSLRLDVHAENHQIFMQFIKVLEMVKNVPIQIDSLQIDKPDFSLGILKKMPEIYSAYKVRSLKDLSQSKYLNLDECTVQG